ncbi:hypothetical protein FVB32_05395 [Flagellimonas hymeniacidonis]|uniref:Cyanobacterial TRADD-N associated 2 transmembrane domain-containing protein n=1 Tax=Flagellimonas hymeniacidonis TaxID=2603628 RepID=A0A5C8V6J5_9FLAO|nr:hypothetical protein [Flagellimonas hymeniacidonis]TXN37724.1 hypothetical protein FVB32_05395 [Flagellimonas hymeniacidonis]
MSTMKQPLSTSAPELPTLDVPNSQEQAPNMNSKYGQKTKELRFKFNNYMLLGFKVLQFTTIIICILGVLLFGFGVAVSYFDSSNLSITEAICGPLISIISGLMIKPLNELRQNLNKELNSQIRKAEIEKTIDEIKNPETKEEQQVKYLDYLLDIQVLQDSKNKYDERPVKQAS